MTVIFFSPRVHLIMNNSIITNKTTIASITVEICFPVFDRIEKANISIRQKLSLVYIILGIISVTVNSFTVYAIVKTRQHQNKSTRLIMIANIGDVISVVFNNFTFIVYVMFVKRLSCKLRIMIFVLSSFSFYFSAYLICIIGVDRYLRIRTLDRYQETLSRKKFTMIFLVLLIIIIIQSLFAWIGSTFYGPGYAATFTIPINLVMALTIIISYTLSIIKLKSYMRNQQVLSVDLQDLINMAAMYILVFGACYSIGIIYQAFITVLLKALTDTQMGIVTFSIYFIPSISGITKALLFISKNTPSRNVLMDLLRSTSCLRSQNVVVPEPAQPAVENQ